MIKIKASLHIETFKFTIMSHLSSPPLAALLHLNEGLRLGAIGLMRRLWQHNITKQSDGGLFPKKKAVIKKPLSL